MSGFLSDVGNFAKGVGEGVWGGATGLVHGVGTLAEGAYNIATDPNARAQAWNDAVGAAQTAEWAVENPGQAAQAVGQGATNLYNNFVSAEQQASASGNGAEFWGDAVGQGAFAAGTVLVPGLAEAKLAGAAGEAGALAEGAGALAEGTSAVGDASALGGAGAITDEGAGTSFLLRGDARPPSDIFENGFQPWGGDASLQDYVLKNSSSQYVGLTTDPSVAADFATAGGTRDGFVYAADAQPNGIVVNDALPNNPFASEMETAVPGGVPGSQIRGATPIGADGTLGDSSLLNPNYGIDPAAGITPPSLTPPSLTPPSLTQTDGTSLLNGSSLTGAGLLGAGALGNATSPPAGDPASAVPTYSVTYGINPDGSLQTISPPALVSPGDPSITPPAPITADPAPADPISTDPFSDPGTGGIGGGISFDGGGDGGGGGGGSIDDMAEMDAE